MRMDDKKKPLIEGVPPRYPGLLSPLCPYPSRHPYETRPAMASPYSSPSAGSRNPVPPYYPNIHPYPYSSNPQHLRHNPYYPSYYSPPFNPHTTYVPVASIHFNPLNQVRTRPLLTKPPPLMPPPPYSQHYFPLNYPTQYQPRVPPPNPESPVSAHHSQTSRQPSPSQGLSKSTEDENQSTSLKNSPEKSSIFPNAAAPFDPATRQLEFIKSFKFLEEPYSLGEIKDGEMLIRGFIFEYSSSGAVGYLTSGSNMKVEINKEVLYIMGRLVSSSECLWDVLALGANIKAIIKKIPSANEEEEEEQDTTEKASVKYRAVIAWFGEIPSNKDLMPVILQFKNSKRSKKEGCSSNASHKVKESDCNEVESSESSSTLSHILGYIWWANKEQGIMRIYETKGWGPEFSGIIFKADTLYFDGQQASCGMLHFLVAHLNKCDVQARRIESRIVQGMCVKWEAVHIECGPVPLSLIRDVPQSNTGATSESDVSDSSNYESFPDDSDDDDDVATVPQSTTRVNEAGIPLDAQKSVVRNTVERLFSGMGQDSISTSAAKKERKKLKDGEPADIKDIFMIKDLSIGFAAADIETLVNEADVSDLFRDEYSGKHLTGHIINLFPTRVGTGIAQWKSMDYGCVNIIFKQSDMFVDLIPINKVMQLPPSVYERRCNLYVLPINDRGRFGSKVKVVATCGWMGTKPLCIPTPGEQPKAKISLNLEVDHTLANRNASHAKNVNHLSSTKDSQLLNSEWKNAVPKLEDVKTQVAADSTTSSNDFNDIKDGNQVMEGYQTGEVVEIHCNMGKLMSEDGTHHYFSRGHCYLYGVNLCQVELWHVLVHGQKILFNVKKNPKSQAKVTEVVIGWKGLCPAQSDEVERYIKEWCTNNAVPDCAKDILVKQVKKSSNEH